MFLNIEEKSITNHKLLIINHKQLLQVNLKLRLLETFVLDYLLQTPNIETKKKIPLSQSQYHYVRRSRCSKSKGRTTFSI